MIDPRVTYRENDVRGASSIRLVVLLYDQLIQDLVRVARAIDENDIELRGRLLNHAILVIAHLQSPLDFTAGGKVAQNLDLLYNSLRQKLVEAQFFPSKERIRQLITDVLAVREAWLEVERIEKSAPSSTGGADYARTSARTSSAARKNWEG